MPSPRFAHGRILALALTLCFATSVPLVPSHRAAAQVSQALNNASSTLAVAHAVGSDTLVLKAGEGARFGEPSPSRPIRVTVAKKLSLVNGQLVPGSVHTIFLVTSRSGDTLSGLTATEGTTDQAFSKLDPVASLITAGTISEVQDVAATIDLELTEITDSVAAKADDDAVVKLTGPQTVAGPKTFADPLTINAAADASRVQKFTHANGTMAFAHHYSPTVFTGVADNVFSQGWHLEDKVAGQASYTENWESRFVNGAPPNGLLERFGSYISIDGNTTYRPWVQYIDLNNHLMYREYRVSAAKWFGGPNGSIPLLDLSTSGGDGGRVRIENDGAASPLEVVGTTGNIDFQLNSGQHLRLATRQAADATNTTRNGIGIAMNGAYWDGAASAGAAASIQTIVTGNNAFHSLWSVGTSDFAWKNDAKLGLNVPLAKITQNLVMRPGYLAAVESNEIGVFRLIGLNAADRVEVDPDARGTVFANPIHFGAYGAGTGPRIRSGAAGADNFLVINAGSAASSTNTLYLNLDSQGANVEAYGQIALNANGSAGKCLSVGAGSPTGILFAGNGVAHYGIRCTASTGLFELMSAGGNDPRTWTASTASLAVPGYVSASGGVGAGATQVINADGSIKPAHLADAAAANDSMYFSTDSGKLTYKDAAGVSHPLY